jgi:hypothetical protein
MNATEDDESAALLSKATECIPPESVPGMNTDSYNITGFNHARV